MSAVLEIPDGPAGRWWENPNIWTVPGNDPLGPPGPPVVGRSAYLWCTVRNTGDTDVRDARIDFYVSPPGSAVSRATARRIGYANVNVAAGAGVDALCLVPWAPTPAELGHNCVVAEAVSPADPLPVPPPDPFDPPGWHQIAQRNLTVVNPTLIALPIQLSAGPRLGRAFTLAVDVGGELDAEVFASLGLLPDARPARRPLVDAGLATRPDCDTDTADRLDFEMPPGGVTAAWLHLRPAADPEPGDYTLVRVTHRDDGRTAGITYVVSGDRR